MPSRYKKSRDIMPPKKSPENAFLLKIRPMHVQNILFSQRKKIPLGLTQQGLQPLKYNQRVRAKEENEFRCLLSARGKYMQL